MNGILTLTLLLIVFGSTQGISSPLLLLTAALLALAIILSLLRK